MKGICIAVFFLGVFIACLIKFKPVPLELAKSTFQSTGFKIGEITDTSAIVWTRLTRKENPNPANGPMFSIQYKESQVGRNTDSKNVVLGLTFPDGTDVGDLRFAAPGIMGETRVRYKTANDDSADWQTTEWQAVDPDKDHTRQIRLKGLQPNTQYSVRVESRNIDGIEGQTIEGGFRTAPGRGEAEKVVFAVSTGQMFDDRDSDDGFLLYDSILEMDPSFFVHTGDIVYYDDLAKTKRLADWHWQRTYGLPSNVRFHRQVGSYFMKDDHDTWRNDCWPTMQETAMYQFTFKQGQEVFRYQVPMGKKTYRTFRWGKDLQIWMMEGRDFRSSKELEDGPEKTIWGTEQKKWFKETVENSNATFRVLISPTTIVGPDRKNKRDNHSNADYAHEGDEIRTFLSKQKNMIVVCGDRHWQHHSVDPVTDVHEFSCGAASDAHAGGWRGIIVNQHQQFLEVKGGFLTVTVEREKDTPVMTCRMHAIDGTVRYEKRFEARQEEAVTIR